MFCPKCGCKNRGGAKFCAECGNPMPQEGGAAPASEAGATVTEASAAPSETDPNATESTGKLGAFLRKPVNFLGHTVPMFGAILAILLATAGIATAAFLIYQNTVAAQEQQQEQVVKTKKVKKAKKKVEEKTEEVEEDADANDQAKNAGQQRKRTALNGSAPTAEAPESEGEQQPEATEEVEPPASNGQEQATAPVANTYDPASEAGSWTGQMVAFNDGTTQLKKSGSYKEGVLACGRCYGATNQPLSLNITSVDASSRTASGTVSFLLHAHNGPVDKDESSDSGDVYIQNVAFSAISIDGWRYANMIDIYSGHGKTVQMSLRLKYGSTDDYSVWIRTVPTDPDPSKPGMYRWGQTDMYTITKN